MFFKLAMIFLSSIALSCSGEADESSSTRSGGDLSGENLEEVNDDPSIKNSSGNSRADLPVVITGAYLTCSLMDISSAKETVVGCNVKNGDDEVIDNPEEKFDFVMHDKDANYFDDVVIDGNSDWQIMVKTNDKVTKNDLFVSLLYTGGPADSPEKMDQVQIDMSKQ